LIISLPSSVATKSFSITNVSTGFVIPLTVALAVLRNDPGIFNINEASFGPTSYQLSASAPNRISRYDLFISPANVLTSP
jgi:hypothetical protein